MAEYEKLNIYSFSAKRKRMFLTFLENKVVIYFYYKKLAGRLNRKI